MYHQFNIQQLYVLPTQCIYVFCIYLRTNSDLCHLQHKLIGFYNPDEKCLERGTDWVFATEIIRRRQQNTVLTFSCEVPETSVRL